MRILVTGDMGTIGRSFKKAIPKQHVVLGIDLFHNNKEDHKRCDITQHRQIESIFQEFQPEVVYHLAAEFGRENGEQYYEQLWATNVIGTRHILNLCVKQNCKLVFASSSEVYGNLPIRQSEIDTTIKVMEHHNDYAITKYVNEKQIKRYKELNQLKAMVLRFFNAYGPGEYYTAFRSAVCMFCYLALHDQPIPLYEGYFRVFMYIDDFIKTLVTTIDNFVEDTINIGGTEYRSMEDVVMIIEKCLNKKLNVVRLGVEAANVINKQPNICKAQQYFQHNPSTTLEEGIKKTLEWMINVGD